MLGMEGSGRVVAQIWVISCANLAGKAFQHKPANGPHMKHNPSA